MKFLVVPSNRPERLREFFEAWKGNGGWDRVIVVEDAPTKSSGLRYPLSVNLHAGADYHYAWDDIDRILGSDAWIISREDSAIRCFGFLAAHHFGATSVLTLDDDCFPDKNYGNFELFGTHLLQMDRHCVWVPSVPNQRTRGIPYTNLGRLDNVKVNVGLWTNIGDWDSIQERPAGFFKPPYGSRIVPNGQLTAMCGMNLCFKREAIPLMYFPLQGMGQPYRRFDDIWAGVIAKTLMDRLNWSMSVGEPFVEHKRASDPEVNRVKEAPGLKANEWFWQAVRSAAELPVGSPLEMMKHLGFRLFEREWGSDVDGEYLHDLGQALTTWSTLFNKKLEF